MEHFKQYVCSKDAYFIGKSKQNRYESVTAITKRVFGLATTFIAFITGKNIDAILKFFKTNFVNIGTFRYVLNVLGILSLFAIVYCLRAFLGAEFLKKENKLREQKETWLRHVEVICNYQNEMFEFLWDLNKYQKCKNRKQKEELFMKSVLDVWMKDNTKFRTNMQS